MFEIHLFFLFVVAVVVYSSDFIICFVQNEYLASCDLRREFISGFSGSAGMNIILSFKSVPTPPSG